MNRRKRDGCLGEKDGETLEEGKRRGQTRLSKMKSLGKKIRKLLRGDKKGEVGGTSKNLAP